MPIPLSIQFNDLPKRLIHLLGSACLIALLMLCIGGLYTKTLAEALPDLSNEQMQRWDWRQEQKNTPPFLMVDFYSQYCGVCKSAEPYLKEMQGDLKDYIRFQRVDIMDEPALAKQYQVEGTPTYILFNALGTPIYRMHQFISTAVLYTQLQRFSGALLSRKIPDMLLPKTPQAEYTLISIRSDACPPSQNTSSQSKFCQDLSEIKTKAAQSKLPLAFIQWNPKEKNIGAFLVSEGWDEQVAYILLDPQHRELYQTSAKTPLNTVWKNMLLLMDRGF